MRKRFSRRDVLQDLGCARGRYRVRLPLRPAAPPAASHTTPELIAAARKKARSSGTRRSICRWPSASPKRSKPNIRASRCGWSAPAPSGCSSASARNMPAGIHAVDVVNSSDAAHFIVWKQDGILAPYVPEDVAKHYPAEHKDPDGQFASFRVWLCTIGYNTDLVKAEDAPKSFADLLDPKWKGKMVKAHPGYSGTIMTATYQMAARSGLGVFREAGASRT